MRLQKYLARCGVASRRKCEDIIASGRVRVNENIVSTHGVQVEPGQDTVYLDGKMLSLPEVARYIVLNKPAGVIVSDGDPQGRRTVMDLLAGAFPERIFPVGRLDYDTEGVLLLTNDGDFANAVAHPKHEIEKRYYAEAAGAISDAKLEALRKGIVLDGRKTAPARILNVRRTPSATYFSIVIHEGRNRQIRRMVEGIGHHIRYLRRDQVGPVTLAGLAAGQWRNLTSLEIKKLKGK
ncbi:MAG: rRNA pseudouridine synthase [Clostridiales bacterium]|nr:rRNA pseudouridine synthase [Clostridiales bacterium]